MRFPNIVSLCLALGAASILANPCIGQTAQVDWNLAQAYQNSTHVFYGTIEKIIPEPEYKTGVMGVSVTDMIYENLPETEVIWSKAREITFQVSEPLSPTSSHHVVAYDPGPLSNVWPKVGNAAGDVFLAKPMAPSPLFEALKTGDSGLFFIRNYLGSTIPVLYHVRFGQRADRDLEILRPYLRSNGAVPIDALIERARIASEAAAAQEAAEFKVFEDEYYRILRSQDLDIRASLLNDLIQRMGFQGRWDYFEFKERTLKNHGAYLAAGAIPKGPTEGKEKLWHDISGELEKIDTIQKARRK